MNTVLSFPRLLAGAGLLWITATAFAQTSLNVKVRAEAPEVRTWLAQAARPGSSKQAPPAPLAAESRTLAVVNALHPEERPASAISRIFTLDFRSGSEQEHLEALLASGLFEFVEPNRLHRTDTLMQIPVAANRSISPNDDSLSKQWYHAYIGTFDAWTITRGSSAIRIGVIDTGLDFDHEELQGQVYVRPGEDLNANGTFEPWPFTETRNGKTGDFDGTDNDGNGYADDVAGYDFVDQPRSPFGGDYLDQDPYPLDQQGHGTVVSGIAVARADNGKGGAGIAPDCRVVVLRAFNNQGAGEDDDIARAIVYAADNSIPVLNFSFGDAYASRTMYEAIRYAYAKGVTMVASAGNGTGDNPHYPSDYSEVLSVAATDANGTREYLWPLSSFGVSTDLAAPGSRIFAPILRDSASDGTVTQYVTTQGTSTAAPMVSAAIGLLFARQGQSLPPRQVRGMLTTTCDDLGVQGWDHYTGAGRLNIPELLGVQGAAIVQIGSPLTDDAARGDEIAVIATVLDPAFAAFSLEYQPGAEGLSTWIPLLEDLKYQVKDDTLLRWNISLLSDGIYTLRLRVNRSDGLTTEDRVRIRIDRSSPEIALGLATTAWDNNERGLYVTYRDSDPGTHQLRFREAGTGGWQTMTNDRKTQNGDFLIKGISDGFYEMCILATDNSGALTSSDTMLVPFQDQGISLTAYRSVGDSLPLGNFLSGSFDFDRDGWRECVMSQYDSALGFGPLCIYEYSLNGFLRVDSLTLAPVLIPKGVADTDGDGLLELLCSVRDSTWLLEQKDNVSWPSEIIYSNFTPSYYAAGFADTDGDGAPEMIMRQSPVLNGRAQPFVYDIWKGGGGSWEKDTSLPDPTPYEDIGGATSRVVTGDFDNDGQQETLFGDYDGDLWIYEFSAAGGYALTWQDSSSLTHAGDYLVAGDLDGNAGLEFVSYTCTRPGRLNNDNEYDPVYAEMKVWQTTGDNQFGILHQEILYDVDAEDLQAVTLGELNGRPGAECVVSSYPRTYIFSHTDGGFQMEWFRYGTLCTDHLIGDFDKNGTQELLLGTGDKAERFGFDTGYAGPLPVNRVSGIVLNESTVKVDWLASPNAASYTLWRVRNFPASSSLTLIAEEVSSLSWIDTGLDSGVPYLYLVQSVNPSLEPGESDLLQAGGVILTPHVPNQVVSVVAINAHQVQVVFEHPVETSEQFTRQIRLHGGEAPVAVSNAATTLLVSFAQPFDTGMNQMEIDTLLLDVQRGVLSASDAVQQFAFAPVSDKTLYLTNWQVVDPQTALLRFRWPVTEAALDPVRYEVAPIGEVVSVKWSGTKQDAVLVHLSGARLGALGYPVSIAVQQTVCTPDVVCMRENEGNVATFTSFAGELDSVYVYPNPVVLHDMFAFGQSGMVFGNLVRECQIQVLTASGDLVAELEEAGEGDGGLRWDMIDKVSGERVAPGLYVYRVWDEDGHLFVGQFSVLE